MKPLLSAILATALAALLPTAASAQAFPNRPIRVVTPFSAGSGPDAALRVVADKLGHQLGTSVIVDNKPGGNGFIALSEAKRAPADGYTLVQMDDTHMSLMPYLHKSVPYDMLKDFQPVQTLLRTNFFVVVPANSPWKNVGDLLAAAKAKPGALTYGSWFIGSPGHLGAVVMQRATDTDMLHIPFKNTPDVYQAVAANDVNWAFGTAGSAGPLQRAGKVKFLALAAPKRFATFADVPTVAEAGGPADLEVKAWVVLQAPKGTPADVVAKLNDAIAKVLKLPEVRDQFANAGFEPMISSPAEITTLIQADMKRYAEVVKQSRITAE